MDYTVLQEVTPYDGSFLFHIFQNSDKIYLNETKTALFVWIQEICEEYSSLGLKKRIRVEIVEDGLNVSENAYEIIRALLKREIINFEEYDFEPSDILVQVQIH